MLIPRQAAGRRSFRWLSDSATLAEARPSPCGVLAGDGAIAQPLEDHQEINCCGRMATAIWYDREGGDTDALRRDIFGSSLVPTFGRVVLPSRLSRGRPIGSGSYYALVSHSAHNLLDQCRLKRILDLFHVQLQLTPSLWLHLYSAVLFNCDRYSRKHYPTPPPLSMQHPPNAGVYKS